MRVYGRPTTLLLALLLVILGAPSASALVVHQHGRFVGLTPHRNVNRAALLKAIQGSSTSTSGSTSTGTTSTRVNLNYHNGPVVHSSAPYLVFWAPPGEAIPDSWQALMKRYFTDVAADSGKATNEYAVDRQYTDGSGYAAASRTFSGSQVVIDTQPYPSRDATNCPHVGGSYPTCLTDTQIQDEVQRVINARGLPTDGPTGASSLPANAPIYFVVLPSDVNACLPLKPDGTGDCADNDFCAYHSSVVDGGKDVLYATVPTLPLGAGQNPKSCQYDGTTAVQEPNGTPADVVLSYLSHEDTETITDPLGNGWYSTYTSNEVADNCNSTGAYNPANQTNPSAFLPTLGNSASPTLYDQAFNGNRYYVQSVWSNGDVNCELQPTTGTTVARMTAPSGTLLAGTSLSFGDSSSTGPVTSATWDWGDGTTESTGGSSPLSSVSHAYSTGGRYTVTLTLIDNRGNASTATQTVTVYPTAVFSYSPSQVFSGTPVTFDASSSTEPGATISTYAWDFGDDTAVASGPSPRTTHTYTAPGTFTVQLTVTDSAGRKSTASQTVVVSGPTASITISPSAASVGEAVSLAGYASDPSASITNYAWDFGDGQTSSGSTETNPSHAYATSGIYTVVLTVTDANGASAAVSKQVTVGPTAAFTVAPGEPADGEAATFDGSGSSDAEPGQSITSYTWHFGDGAPASTSTTPQATHIYRDPGTYTATLTVTNGAGETSTSSHVLTVTDTPPTVAFSVSTTSPSPPGKPPTAVIGVATVPVSGRITKVIIKPARGGATVAVSVSSAGTLTVGHRVFHLRRPATVRVLIALTRAQLRAVQVERQLKVRVRLRFAPVLGPLGTTSAVIAFRAVHGRIAGAAR